MKTKTFGGALLLVALLVTFLAEPNDVIHQAPSVKSAGPNGLKVLATWLEKTGVDVRVGTMPLSALPGALSTVVLTAPTAREISTAELEALERFVRDGGTLVALLPREQTQKKLFRWLHVSLRNVAPLVHLPNSGDFGGTTVRVQLPGGILTHVHSLRLSAETMAHSNAKNAVAVTEPPALWWLPLGHGEIWVTAGAQLAENARLELLDNAAFWAAVGARGPIWFDEYHHQQASSAKLLHLFVTFIQAVLVSLLFVAVKGTRFGFPRDEPQTTQRSTLEYVRAMAALTARAKIEAQLVESQRSRLRRTLHDSLGIATAIPLDRAAQLAAQRSRLTAHQVHAAATAEDFLMQSRLIAEIEGTLEFRDVLLTFRKRASLMEHPH